MLSQGPCFDDVCRAVTWHPFRTNNLGLSNQKAYLNFKRIESSTQFVGLRELALTEWLVGGATVSTLLFMGPLPVTEHCAIARNRAERSTIAASMSSGFVSGGTSDQPTERDDEWLEAQQEIEATRRRKEEESRQEGGKTLYEVLQQNKGDYSKNAL